MKSSIKFLAIGLILGVGVVGTKALSETIKFNPIKPVSGKPLTDEQQGILAVRLAKASIVNILGVSRQSQSTSTSLTITAVPTTEAGTGFVADADGTIITNNHVVENQDLDYWVFLPDGTKYAATIVGQDKFDDVAVIKISATNLTPAHLGDSDSLETGQTVFAIGNSLGKYEDSVTKGVVSGLQRAVDNADANLPRVQNLIQTDAAISPGNSGGPLINLSGEVVGMNTLIDTEGQLLDFAVPVNVIKDSISQLKTFGKVSRPYVGVQFLTIDAVAQIEKHLPVSDGALITAVAADSPASRAGVMVGDIIVGVNNLALTQKNALDVTMQKFQAGNQVTLKISRNEQMVELPIILGEFK